MSSFNKVVLMGNLTRDPELRDLPGEGSGKVVDFAIACNRKFKTQAGEDREETTFVDCAAFGKQAETIARFCRKGKALLLEGRLRYDAWQDKETGSHRSRLSVVVETFQFVGPRQADETPAPTPPARERRERKFKEAEIPF